MPTQRGAQADTARRLRAMLRTICGVYPELAEDAPMQGSLPTGEDR